MTKKTALKIVVDVVMTIVYILLMFDFGLGKLFHEVAGIAVGVIFLAHVLLNIKPFKAMFKQLKKGKLSFLRSILLICDVILPFTMLTVIVTGILIANTLYMLPIDGSTCAMIFTVHNFCAYVTLAIMALHLLLHAKYLVGIFKKGVKNGTGKVIATLSASAMLFFFCYMLGYSLFAKNPLQTTTTPSDIDTTTTVTNSETITQPTSAYNDSENVYYEQTETESATDEQITEVQTEQEPAVTLEDFLSKLICTGCHNRCPLTNPRCSTGREQAQAAEQQYYEEYNISE